MALVREGGELILLVKPQFEASRQEASRGRGVIRDAAVWRRVLDEVIASAEQHGAHLLAATTSPIRGGDGNVEFLVYLGVGRSGVEVDLDALVDSVC